MAPRAYVTYYQARGLSGHTSPCGECARSDDQRRYASRCTYISFQKYKWSHFPGRESFSFFLRAPYILRTTYFFGDNGGQRCQVLKPHCSEKVEMACRIRIHGARGLAVGDIPRVPQDGTWAAPSEVARPKRSRRAHQDYKLY